MNLTELLTQLDMFDSEQTIYVDEGAPLSATVAVSVAEAPEDDSIPFNGMRELIDVWHARESFDGCRKLLQADGVNPTHDDCVQRYLQFLENDA